MEENRSEINKVEIEISLKDLFSIFIKNLWIMILCAILCGTVVYIYNKKYIVPIYRSEVTFYIVPVGTLNSEYSESARLQMEYQSLLYAKQVMNTYLEIFRSRTFISKLAEDYAENYGKRMNGSISAMEVADTELFKLRVSSTSKEDAYEIAKQLEKTAPEMIMEVTTNDRIRIVDRAIQSEFPVNNNTNRNTLIGLMFGAVAVYGVAFLIYIFDRRVKSEEDLKNHYDIPILGGIVDFDKTYKDKGRQYY